MAALTDTQIFALAMVAAIMVPAALGMASHLRDEIAAACGRSVRREG